MAHVKSILVFTACLLLGAASLPLYSMNPYEPSAKNKQRMAATSQKVDEMLVRSEAVLKEAEELLQQTQQALKAPGHHQEETPGTLDSAAAHSPIVVIPVPERPMPGLAEALDGYFQTEQIDPDILGAQTGDAIQAHPALPTSPAPQDSPVTSPPAEPIQEQPVQQQSDGQPPFLSDDLGYLAAKGQADPAPAVPQPVATAMPDKPVARPSAAQPNVQIIDESFLADILNNIAGAKGPMLTASTLGVVHYLYENQVFNHAIGVRSPKMKEYLHEYVLPTAREALAAHLIQLLLPHLPYLNTKDIRSYSTANYLGSYVTTKALGVTALYFAKLVTKTKQGKNLVTQYKRLPKKTKETIEKVAPWLDFIRNMFMARSLAGYIE